MYKKKLKKSAVVLGIILTAALTVTGCKKNKNSVTYTAEAPMYEEYYAKGGYGEGAAVNGNMMDYMGGEAGEYDYAMEEAEMEPAAALDNGGGYSDQIVDSGSTSSSVGNTDKRKLIRTVDLQVETKEYDNLRNGLEEQIKALGGYIENEYSYNGSTIDTYDYNYGYGRSDRRYTNMTIRIPDANLDSFVTVMSGMSNVVSKTSTATDVSLQYTDLESKRDMYRAEQESLMLLLEKAETIEDITYLTSRLTDVRYSIESMERQLRLYDNQVDYATVHLNVTEVEVLTPQVVTPKTPAEEIREGFQASKEDVINSLKRFGMDFVINIPYIIRTLVILAIIGGIGFAVVRIIIAIVKANVKKSRAKKAARKAAEQNRSTEQLKTDEKEKTENTNSTESEETKEADKTGQAESEE